MRRLGWAAARCRASRHTLQGPGSPLAFHCRASAARCRARRHRRGLGTALRPGSTDFATALSGVARAETKTSRSRRISNPL